MLTPASTLKRSTTKFIVAPTPTKRAVWIPAVTVLWEMRVPLRATVREEILVLFGPYILYNTGVLENDRRYAAMEGPWGPLMEDNICASGCRRARNAGKTVTAKVEIAIKIGGLCQE